MCKDYWWTNLLYINNLWPWSTTGICVGQTWYLSNDMQFFCLAPIFIYALWKSPIIGESLHISAFSDPMFDALDVALITCFWQEMCYLNVLFGVVQ